MDQQEAGVLFVGYHLDAFERDARLPVDQRVTDLLKECGVSVGQIKTLGDRAVNFAPSEVDFLFAGPFVRRELLVYRVLFALGGILMMSAVLTILLSVFGAWWPAVFVGVALSLLLLHQIEMCLATLRETLEDFFSYASFFFTGEVAYDEAARAKLVVKDQTPAQTAKTFRLLLEEAIDPILDWRAPTIEEALRVFGERHELSSKQLFMPVRVAVTGRPATPPLFETMAVLGKEICRRRLRGAIEALRAMKT